MNANDKAGIIWPMLAWELVTVGECGSRLNAVRKGDEKKGVKKSAKPRSEADKQQRTCTRSDTVIYVTMQTE